MATGSTGVVPEDALSSADTEQDWRAMRARFIRYGVMILPEDPLHGTDKAIDGQMLTDAVDTAVVKDNGWNTSTALTRLQKKRKVLLDRGESAGAEHMIGTVLLCQEIKITRQRRRIAQLEAAITGLRENAVLAYERMIAEDA